MTDVPRSEVQGLLEEVDLRLQAPEDSYRHLMYVRYKLTEMLEDKKDEVRPESPT